jgi:hypothetical protein
MHLTQHASARATQRSVPNKIVEAIFMFGDERPAPGGAMRITLDRASIALAADGSPQKHSQLERYRNTYLMVGSDGRVITVARQRRRFFN